MHYTKTLTQKEIITNIPTQFYSVNGQLAQTKLYSSNSIAISVNRSDWHLNQLHVDQFEYEHIYWNDLFHNVLVFLRYNGSQYILFYW